MAETGSRNFGVRQISEVANRLVDPVLAKRAGISTALLGSWPDIAGADFANCTRPEKILWERRASQVEDDAYRPGSLVIACEGARALFLSHVEAELIQRINSFFGFPAICKIRIVQKPVSPPPSQRPKLRALDAQENRKLEALVTGVENDKLREALKRLGKAVIADTSKT
jgi:hypothetical protein